MKIRFSALWRACSRKSLNRRPAPIRSVMMKENDLDHLTTLHRTLTKSTKR